MAYHIKMCFFIFIFIFVFVLFFDLFFVIFQEEKHEKYLNFSNLFQYFFIKFPNCFIFANYVLPSFFVEKWGLFPKYSIKTMEISTKNHIFPFCFDWSKKKDERPKAFVHKTNQWELRKKEEKTKKKEKEKRNKFLFISGKFAQESVSLFIFFFILLTKKKEIDHG